MLRTLKSLRTTAALTSMLALLLVVACGALAPATESESSSLRMLEPTFPAAVEGKEILATLKARGGQAPYTWELLSGALPQGLALNTQSGVIGGTPSYGSHATYDFTLQVSDALGAHHSLALQWEVGIADLHLATTAFPSFANIYEASPMSFDLSTAASGGLVPYTWSITSNADWVHIDATSGRLFGTPPQGSAGSSSSVTIVLRDADAPPRTVQRSITLVVKDPAPEALGMMTVNLPDAVEGVSYLHRMIAYGGVAPLSFSSADLPGWLALDTSTGVLSGNPPAAGTLENFSVRVSDSASPAQSDQSAYSLRVLPVGSLCIIADASGVVTGATGGSGSGYMFGTAGIGIGKNTWFAEDGNAFHLALVEDSAGNRASREAFGVADTLSASSVFIMTTSLPKATEGGSYSFQLSAIGGDGNYAWSLSDSSQLASGLQLSADGLISGIPTVNGLFTFVVVVQSSDGQNPISNATELGITVQPEGQPLSIATVAMPTGTVLEAYSEFLSAAGGSGQGYQFSLANPADLPPGLSLAASSGSPAVFLTGTPTTAGLYAFTVEVVDSDANDDSAMVILEIVDGAGSDSPWRFVGTGDYGHDKDGKAGRVSMLAQPGAVFCDVHGNTWIADTFSQRIRKASPTGIVTTVAGSGKEGWGSDGVLATDGSVALNFPFGVAVDTQGNLFIADTMAHRVCKVDRYGYFSVIAGSGVFSFGDPVGDGGPAHAAAFYFPFGITVDAEDNLYVSEYAGRIRKLSVDPDTGDVTRESIMTRFAGIGFGYSGSEVSGPAVLAALSWPKQMAFDADGNMYVADDGALMVTKIDTDGMISKVVDGVYAGAIALAPNGDIYLAGMDMGYVAVYRGGVLDTFKNIPWIHGLSMDPEGYLLMADYVTNTVLRVPTE